MNSLQKIGKYYDQYSTKEKLIADFFLQHTDKVVTIKIQGMAAELGVSTASISKFVKKYCKMSFQELKVYLAMDSEQSACHYSQLILNWGNDFGKLPKNILEEINVICRGVMEVNDVQTVQNVVDMIYHAENIYFFAVGSSALIANDFVLKLMRLGKHCTYSADGHTNLLNSQMVTQEDLAIFVSFDGRTKEVNVALNEVQKRGVQTVAITRYGITKLSSQADTVLSVPSFELENARIAPIFSRYGQMFIVDMLFLGLTQKLNGSLEDFIDQNNTLFEQLKDHDRLES